MITSKMMRYAIVALLVAGATVALVFVEFIGKSTASATSTNPPTFAVFDRPVRAQDDISSWRIPEEVADRVGLQRGRSRVIFQSDARTVAVVPSSFAGLCLAERYQDGGGGMGCSDDNRFVTALGYNGALGIVPDSVHSVTVTLTDGSVQVIPVEENVWRGPVEGATATFNLDGKVQKIELMPRSSLPAGAELHPDGLVTSKD